MSRDLTCNETMPALDDSDGITDVRRMVPSRIIGQQSFVTSSLNLMASNRNTPNNGAAPSMTVRDVVSNRIRNRGNDPIASNLSSGIHQTSAPSGSAYMTKPIGIAENVNANNLLHSILHNTARPTTNTNSQPAGKYINISLNNSNNPVVQQQPQQLQQQVIQQSAAGQPQYIVSTSTIPVQRIAPPTTTVTTTTAAMYRQQAPPAIASTVVDVTPQISQKIGISIAYDAAALSNNNMSQPIFISNTNNNGASLVTQPTVRTQPAMTTTTQSIPTGYVIPPASSATEPVVSAAGFIVQRTTDSPEKPIYLNRHLNSSASPSPVVFSTTSSHYLQQVHPPPSRPISAYPPEMTVGSVVRASGSNSNFIITPLPSAVSGNGNCVGGGVLSRGASPYAVVLSRSESVLRESPNGMSNHESTTPNGSQPPNSHSSPRPSILRGNSAARRFVERDATPVSSVTHFSAVNFADHNALNVSSVNFYTSNATSSSTSNDGMTSDSRVDGSSNFQDDSPRKRQRKQQFDNSQVQDKLMMEVHTDPRHEQLATENTTMWKASGQIQPMMSKTTYASGDYGSALSGREPRRRGRPRSVNRSAELQMPSCSRVLMNTTAHNINNSGGQLPAGFAVETIGIVSAAGASQLKFAPSAGVLPANHNVNANPTVVAYGTAPPPSSVVSAIALSDSGSGDAAPRSFMVDVDDCMLQVPPGSKRPRKYKKRTPELDPNTGEPVKKPRKKGSGRKSKKDMMLLEATKREIDVYRGSGDGSPTVGEVLTGANHHHLAELQQQLYQQQPPNYVQPPHSGGRYATTYVNTAAVTVQPTSQLESNHYVQPLAHQMTSGKFIHVASTASAGLSKTAAATTVHAQMAAEERRVIVALCQLKSTAGSSSAADMIEVSRTDVEKSEQPQPAEEDEEAAVIDESTTTAAGCSQPPAITTTDDQLLDAAKFRELAVLWKTADRNLAGSLADDYDKVYDFFSNLRTDSNVKGQQQRSLRWTAHDDRRELCCPVFDSFEDFKRSMDALKLLPTTCHYYKSSRTLLDSLRANLYGFSAYQLAKTLIAESGGAASSATKIDAKRVRLIASAVDGLQGKCEDLFHYLYDELKRQMHAPITKRDDTPVNAAKSMLVDMHVVDLLDQLIDNVDRATSSKVGDSQTVEQSGEQSVARNVSTPAVHLQFPNPLLSGEVATPLASIRRLAPLYRELLTAVGSRSSRSRRRPRRRRPNASTSSESETGPLLNVNGVNRSTDDDSDIEQPSDEKRVEYVVQKVREFVDRSQRTYRLARRQSIRLLARLEPARYQEFVGSTTAAETRAVKLATGDETAERIRDDMETSFLLDIPRHKSLFKPLNIYNSTKSITMKPPADVVKRIFRHIEVPCYSTSSMTTAVEEPDKNRPRPKAAPTAVDRLRDSEKNFFVSEEIREMELNSSHIVAVAVERLRRKYGDRHHLGWPAPNQSNTDEETNSVDDKIFLPHFANFDPSLKRQFPCDASEDVKAQFFKDQCREVHEMAAVVVSLSHTRANILHQCLDSLVDVIGVTLTAASQSSKAPTTTAVTTMDSDAEVETMPAVSKLSTHAAAANGGVNVYDYDIYSVPSSPAHAATGGSGSDSDHSNSDDGDGEPDGSTDGRTRKTVQSRQSTNNGDGRFTNDRATAIVAGISGAKKRRWSGYHRQVPVAGSAPAQPSAITAASLVALAK